MSRNHRTEAILGTFDIPIPTLCQLASGHTFHYFGAQTPTETELRRIWAAIGERLTQRHSLLLPGSRPHAWWRFSALEKRVQVDGPVHSMLKLGSRVPPAYFYGRPSNHGPEDMDCTFECQCAYLERLELFTPDEQRRANASDWLCSACQYVGFGEPSLSREQVQGWYEALTA